MRKLTSLFLAFALSAFAAHAEVAKLIPTQEFTGYSANSGGTSPTEIGTDWWRIYAQPGDWSAATGDSGANYSLKLVRTMARANRGRTIITPPVSGNIGKVEFRAFYANPITGATDGTAYVFLGSETGYKDCTGWPDVEGVSVYKTVTLSASDIGNGWVTLSANLDTIVDASHPLRVGIGLMGLDVSSFDVYIDNVTVYEMPSTLLEATPLTTTEGLPYAVSGLPGTTSSIHPEISFSTIGTVSDVAVTLKWRFAGTASWTDRPMVEENGVWHVQGGDLTVGDQSGKRLEMYVVATYMNELEVEQLADLTYTAENPLSLDIVPRNVQNGHVSLATAGAFTAPMTLATNGVWVGGYERKGGVQDTTFRFTFGEGQSMSYGATGRTIPFEGVVYGGQFCTAPQEITRDVVFRFSEVDGYLGTALYADYQSFENWEETSSNGWSVVNTSGNSGVVADAGATTNALEFGGAALLLRAGDKLRLDKSSWVGVGEVGFLFRPVGAAPASVTVKRSLSGSATLDELGTYTANVTNCYSYARRVIGGNQGSMDTALVELTANADVYLDGVYASDCSTVRLDPEHPFEISPDPIRQNEPITVTAKFVLGGGGKLKADTVVLKYGQGTDTSCTTNEIPFTSTDGVTWVAVVDEGVSRADKDFYAYITGMAQDYGNNNIGTITGPTTCVQVIPYSAVEWVSVANNDGAVAMRLADECLWKGAVPQPQDPQEGATFWFLDSDGVRRGDANASVIPANGNLSTNAAFTISSTIRTALAFEYDEALQTYRIQLACYDPMRNGTPANPAWTRTSATVSTNFDGCLQYAANGRFVSPPRDGVGEVTFWAARAGNASVTYTVKKSTKDTGDAAADWTTVKTGVISGENMRFFSALVGDPKARRIRVEFTGGPAYVQDAVVTASGSYVEMSDAQISEDGTTFVPSASTVPEVAYGDSPVISIGLDPKNEAYNIQVSVLAVMADLVNGVAVPVDGADVVSVPMNTEGPDANDHYTFQVDMPALTAGVTAYRFVAVYDGENATQTEYPEAVNGVTQWYAYRTKDELDPTREPDFSKIDHDGGVMLSFKNIDGWRVNKAYLSRSELNAIGFTPASGDANTNTYLRTTSAYDGIGRIYFRAFCVSPFGNHDLLVQTGSSQNGPWETLNIVSIVYGTGTGLNAYSQYCIEVNDYCRDENGNPAPKFIRIVRDTDGADESDYIFLRDLVVTPPAANMFAEIPSIIHPGYPSKSDPVTFSATVANVYDAYPAVNPSVTMHHRRVSGSVAGAWESTKLASSDGTDFSTTLPAMNPGRFEYYLEVDFSGASYRYEYLPNMPLYFYYADGGDEYLTEDPRNGNEACNPLYVFAEDQNPAEFSHETATRSLEAPSEYENRFLWFKVRAFSSQHDHLQIVYTNVVTAAGEVAGEVADPVFNCTNALQLIGDNLWLTTISVTNVINDYYAKFEGVAPYGGAGTTEYLAEATVWGDDDQATTNSPLASYAGTDEDGMIRIHIENRTGNEITMMVRIDANNGSYQVRRAAYQDFNDWGADASFFEDSVGLYDVETYEQPFDGSAQYGETAMDAVIMKFDNDVVGDYTQEDYFTSYGWNLHAGRILRERNPRTRSDLVGNVAARIGSSGGYLQNEAGDGAIPDGLEYVKMRVRPTFGGDGHTPYDKTGFAWSDYFVAVSNLHVSAISDGNPYVQVMAAYQDPYDYVALRLTQTATIDAKSGTLPHVRQDLIRVVNGVETPLATTFTRKWNNGKGYANNTNESDGNNVQLLLTADNKDWCVEIDMTATGTVRARAWIPNTTSPINWLTGSGVMTEGTVSCDAFDAVANFRNFHVVVDGTSSNVDTSKWFLGGPQSGDKTKFRWTLEKPTNATGPRDGLTRAIPALAYTIGIGKAGTNSTMPSRTAFETTTTNTVSTTSLGYADATKTVHYWGTSFVRIKPFLSDADLVVDDVEVKPWHGKSLPEEEPEDDRYWQARQAVVVQRNGSRMLALTTSRANPAARQMISTPEMLNGIGPFSFNYEVEGGTVTFVIERNSTGGAYGDEAGYVLVGDEITAINGQKGEIYRNLHEDMTGKVRVRVLPEKSDPDATLYLDNFFAKSSPPDDGRSWTAYNALIVAPTRNATVDEKQFEEDVSTQTAFLNNAVDQDTRTNTTYLEHLPYIQSPKIDTGVGEIAFWYRAWNPRNPVPGQITFWVAEDGDAPDSQWRQITEADLARPERPKDSAPQSDFAEYETKLAAYEEQVAAFRALTSITNGDYQYFSAEICNDTNYVLRICSDTNGTQRVAIDNVIVTEPVRASIDVLDVSLVSAQSHSRVPLGGEDVGFEVRLGNPRMNPTNIKVEAEYHIGTNVWGVANWAGNPDGSIRLVQDENDQYLYRSSSGDLIPGQPIDAVVQYRVRVTYDGTFASPVTSVAFENPEWYDPIDLNEIYADQGFSPYSFVFSCPTGCVYINEFYPAGNDGYANQEFVEILGPDSASVAGWYLDVIDGGPASADSDSVLRTYVLPSGAKFGAPEDDESGWGFYVIGDTDPSISNKVDLIFEDHETANLPRTDAGLRLRRSMGAYVDRVSWGSTSRPAGDEMVERGYRYAGSRSGWGSGLTYRFALVTDSDAEDEVYLKFDRIDPAFQTLGRMNTSGEAEYFGVCPYTIAEDFINATAEAVSAYFDRYLPADFLCQLYINGAFGGVVADALEGLRISVDGQLLTIGDDFTLMGVDANTLGITLKADSLAALNLSTNDVHVISFDVDEGLDPEIELHVIDTTPEAGDKSGDVSIEIKKIEFVNGKVVITVWIVNNEPDKTVEGWSWGVKGASSVSDMDSATLIGQLSSLTDEDVETDLTKEIVPDGDESFYRAVLDDGVN